MRELPPAPLDSNTPMSPFPDDLPDPTFAEAVATVQKHGDVLDALPRNSLINATSFTASAGSFGLLGGAAEASIRHYSIIDTIQPLGTYAAGAAAISLAVRGAMQFHKGRTGSRALSVQEQSRESLGEAVELFRVYDGKPGKGPAKVLVHWLPGDIEDDREFGLRLERLAEQAEAADAGGIIIDEYRLPEQLQNPQADEEPPTLSSILTAGKGVDSAIVAAEDEPVVRHLTIDEALALAKELTPAEDTLWADVQKALKVTGQPALAAQIERYIRNPDDKPLKRQLEQSIRRILQSHQSETVSTARSAADLAANPLNQQLHSHRNITARLDPDGRRLHRVGPDGAVEDTLDIRKSFGLQGLSLHDALEHQGRNASTSKLLNVALVEVWERLHEVKPAERVRSNEVVAPRQDVDDPDLLQPAVAQAYRRYMPRRQLRRAGLERPERSFRRAAAAFLMTTTVALGPGVGAYAAGRMVYWSHKNQITAEVEEIYNAAINSGQDIDMLGFGGSDERQKRYDADPAISVLDDMANARFEVTSLQDELLANLGFWPTAEEWAQKDTEAQVRQEITDGAFSDVGNAGHGANQPIWQVDSFNGAQNEGYWLQNSFEYMHGNGSGNALFSWQPHSAEEPFTPVSLRSPEVIEQSGQPYIIASTPNLRSPNITSLPVLTGYKVVAARMVEDDTKESINIDLVTNGDGEYYLSLGDPVEYYGETHLELWLMPDNGAGVRPPEDSDINLSYIEQSGGVQNRLLEVIEAVDPELLKVNNIREAAEHISGTFSYGVNPLSADDIRQIMQVEDEGDKFILYIQTLYKNRKLNCNLATTLLAMVNEARGFEEPFSVAHGFLNKNDTNNKVHQYLSSNERHLTGIGTETGPDGKSRPVIIDPTPGNGLSAEDRKHFEEKYEQDGQAPDLRNEATAADERLRLSGMLLGMALLGSGVLRRRRSIMSALQESEEWSLQYIPEADARVARAALDLLWQPDSKGRIDLSRYSDKDIDQLLQFLPADTSLRNAFRVARRLPLTKKQRKAARQLLRLATYTGPQLPATSVVTAGADK